jgi:hypothetical protein
LLVAVTSFDGKNVNIPLQRSDHVVRSHDLSRGDNNSIHWYDVEGNSGISGLLSDDDPRAIAARKKFHEITKPQVRALFRRSSKPPECKSETLGCQMVGGQRHALGRRRGKRYGPGHWSRIMIDHGANLFASGAGQRKAYTDATGNVVPLRRIVLTLHTMGGTTKVLGEGNVRIPLRSSPDSIIADVDFRIVNED